MSLWMQAFSLLLQGETLCKSFDDDNVFHICEEQSRYAKDCVPCMKSIEAEKHF